MDAAKRFGSIRRRRKLGEIVAERIIDEIIRRGWNEGEVLGTEADFMERYRISRATFREAARQLEWQGAATMRRGASGGLAVKAPPREAIVSAFRTYFELTNTPRADLDEARTILDAAPRLSAAFTTPNQAIALFLEPLDSSGSGVWAKDRLAGSIAPKLSETIALRLVQDIESNRMDVGASFGSEAELQQRYAVSRAVMREALRLLELHNIVRVKTGANGGIIVQQFDPDYTIELASLYLVYARLPLSDLWEAQSSLEIAAAERCAARADGPTLRELGKALHRLEQAPASHYLASASQFHRVVAESSGSRVIALLVGVLLRFSLSVLPRPAERSLPQLKDQHRALLRACEVNDAQAAATAMRAMFEHSRRWIEALGKTVRSREHRPVSA
jgi:DNA-binding FadR family transcriptional regulator